jgi:hypothetical protein
MRTILRLYGYTLEDGEWTKGDHVVPDDRIEEEHFKVLIETMEKKLFNPKAKAFAKRLGGR